jgi:transposase
VARPTKLDPERQKRILDAIRAGSYAEPACRAAGIAESTFYRWLQRGEAEGRGVYADFAQAVRRAEAEAEVNAVEFVEAQMHKDWRAAIAFLERRHPSRWRRQTSAEISGPGGGPIETRAKSTVDLSLLTDDELQLMETIHARVSRNS